MTYSLAFKAYGGSKDTKTPIPPYVRIITANGSIDEDGNFCLTPNAYLSEIDAQIDRLIKELEEIGKKAKAELNKLS
jgi:hypothetical protein